MTEDRYARGRKVAEQLGNADVLVELARTAPDLERILVEHALGDILARPALDMRTRETASIAMLAALGGVEDYLAVHIGAALNAGLGPAEVVEVLMQVSTFAGYPRALKAVSVAARVFNDRGLSPSDGTPARTVVTQFFDAIEQGDVDAVIKLMSPDVLWDVPGDPAQVPWAGQRQGPDAVRQFYGTLLDAASREDFGIEALLGFGDRVLAPGHFAYRFPATGGAYQGRFVIEFTVRHGLITRYTMHEDSYGLAEAYQNNAA